MEIPKLHKIYVMIPEELYLQLVAENKFHSNFDEFVAKAIQKALEEDSNG